MRKRRAADSATDRATAFTGMGIVMAAVTTAAAFLRRADADDGAGVITNFGIAVCTSSEQVVSQVSCASGEAALPLWRKFGKPVVSRRHS